MLLNAQNLLPKAEDSTRKNFKILLEFGQFLQVSVLPVWVLLVWELLVWELLVWVLPAWVLGVWVLPEKHSVVRVYLEYYCLLV
jgi:hypothetical protein